MQSTKFWGWFILALIAIAIAFFVLPAQAQEKKFPVGVPVQTQALFCLEQKDAQVIADNKGESSPEIVGLVINGKCRQLSGVAVYVKEVYRKGEWAVWELTSPNIPKFYEPPDWVGVPARKRGEVGT